MSLITAGREACCVIATQLWTVCLLLLICAAFGAPELLVTHVLSLSRSPADTALAAPSTTGAVTVRSLGSFQLMEEKDTSSRRAMHVPSGWTKLRLLFTTADRRGYVMLQDDGVGITIEVEVPYCLLSSRYHQYGVRQDESHLYDAMAEAMRSCQLFKGADEYERQLRLARADFPAAISAMKTRAVELFRTLTPRCQVRPRPRDGDVHEMYPACP